MSDDIAPEDYTETMLVKDLALSTALTLYEAGALVHPFLAASGRRPYDVLQPLINLVSGLDDRRHSNQRHEQRPIDRAGYGLSELVRRLP